MVIYVDETENNFNFIVVGLIVNCEKDVEEAYKSFKKSINKTKILPKYKAILFTEFKSTLLDYDYQNLKIKMLKKISEIDCKIYYSVFYKKNRKISQLDKESIYIKLLSNILNSIKECEIDVIIDSFNKRDFESKIIAFFKNNKNISSITPKDSQKIHGLQFVDNLCSVIRLYITDSNKFKEIDTFYKIIERKIKEV